MESRKYSALKEVLRQKARRFHKLLFESENSYCDCVIEVHKEYLIAAKICGFPKHAFLYMVLPVEDAKSEDPQKLELLRTVYLNLRQQ